jgi:integrase
MTFAEAVRHYPVTDMQTSLKSSTRVGYDKLLDSLLLPRFGERHLAEVDGKALSELDAGLVADELEPSTRANVHCVFRSVLRCAVNAGHLPALPRFPALPKVGRQIVRPMRAEHVQRLLATCSPPARLALSLMAFAGLRPSEVQGLRWCDVDLKSGVLAIRGASARERQPPRSRTTTGPCPSAPRCALSSSPWRSRSTRRGRR